MLHRTHMGVDNDYVNTLLHALRTGLADGWGGSMIATELSDVMFGTPKPVMSEVNLGVLKTDQVNIAMHGHNPLLSDVICAAAQDPELVELARSVGASGINIVGLCCTGNEMLMRRGVPMAGNHLMQELVLITGALEAMVVDYQCIMPSIVDVAKCYHTKIISTSDKAKFTGATHVSFDPEHGAEIAKRIVRMAIEAYPDRNHERVRIPGQPVKMMGGFSVEAILGALGGTPKPLVDAIAAGSIRGAVAVVGCNNPKLPQDLEHIDLTRRLIENDILVLVTGCAAVANGKSGQMVPEAAAMAGPGLRAVCESLGIPPVLHVGSCVDNSRIMVLVAALADFLGVDIDQLPVAGAAPEWYSEKAVAIGAYVVASGVTTVLGVQPPVFGSPHVVDLLANGLDGVVGAKFVVEPDPAKAALFIRRHIEGKRQGLGLPFVEPEALGIDDNESPHDVPGSQRDRGLSAMCDTCGGHGDASPGSDRERCARPRGWYQDRCRRQGRSRQVDAECRHGSPAGPRWASGGRRRRRRATQSGGDPWHGTDRIGLHRPGVRECRLRRGEDGCTAGGGSGWDSRPQSRHLRPHRQAVRRGTRRCPPGRHGRGPGSRCRMSVPGDRSDFECRRRNAPPSRGRGGHGHTCRRGALRARPGARF